MSEKSLLKRMAEAAQDPSFIIGGLIVALLLLLAVLGPELAPKNPFFRERIQVVDGEYLKAPIDPMPGFPLGTDPQGADELSLLLYGARTTLIMAFIATLIRILMGIILGSVAGWWPGSLADRIITAVIDFFAAIPSLILAMVVVYAVGIRSGQIAFVVALSVTGWGEVAQIFRSHVLSIRKKDFIESARAVGLNSIGTLSRHVLPNLTATIVTLAALEMGSALLLLGELGLMEVFLGGGGIIAGDAGTGVRAISEIPEWGAMLGTTWRYFKSLPWLPGAPAAAFFIAILGFNLFGYGLQRFIDKGRFYPSGLSVFRFSLIVLAVLVGSRYVLSNTGPEVEYREVAEQFDASRVYQDLTFLTRSELEGRYTGSDGGKIAASYIAQQFTAAGLTPLPTGSYFQPFNTLHGLLTEQPLLEIMEGDRVTLSLSEGIAYHIWNPHSLPPGVVDGELMLDGNPPGNASIWNPAGIFFYVESEEDFALLTAVPDQYVPDDMTHAPAFSAPHTFLEDYPNYLISYTTAADLLAQVGYDFEEILHQVYEEDSAVSFSTGLQVRLHHGLEYHNAQKVNILGYIPGSDIRIQTQRILVVARYSGVEPWQGETYPGADENASGVAVMLEIMRLWAEKEFVPKRTVVFAAVDENGADYFAQNPIIGTGENDSWTVVILDGLGAGEQALARIDAGGGLEKIFDQAVRKMHVRPSTFEDYSFFFTQSPYLAYTVQVQGSYDGIYITNPGDELSGTPDDTLEHVDMQMLKENGAAIAYFLMLLSAP
ncbi:MAG: ABC transporter permease subunit [Anaerolineales bacterium]|nr:ABC transporter permease subunit [Anaerolineales bacterium]